MDAPFHLERPRLLVLGRKAERRPWAEALRGAGYPVEESEPEDAAEALQRSGAELVLLHGAALQGVHALRDSGALGKAALIALVHGGGQALRGAGVDGVIDAARAGGGRRLARQVDQVLRRRRAAQRQELRRLRIQVLADLGEMSASALTLDEGLHRAVLRIAEAIDADRCSAMLVEGAPAGCLHLCATPEHPPGFRRAVDLSRYPEIRRALQTGATVEVQDAHGDPLMAEVRVLIEPLDVRSILVQPLAAHGELLGALYLRRAGRTGAFGPEERSFAQACGGALASLILGSRSCAKLEKESGEGEGPCAERLRELSEANRRLQELNRLKDETLALCSHDLRGPLNIMLGHARLLVESELDAEDLASAQAILRQGKRLFEQLERLLDRGRGELARLALAAARLDVREICREVVAEHAALAAERGVRIEEDLPASIELLADRVKLRQILRSLLARALARAPEGGSVRVQAEVLQRPDGAVARVGIADEGSNLAPDELLTLFERYRRGEGDSGHGLAFCRELVELHGGEIWAEKSRGRGTAAFFTIPVSGEGLSR